MSISLKTDLEWGDIFYIKTDPDQAPCVLVGLIYLPGKSLKFILSCDTVHVEVYDFEASKEKNELKLFDSDDELEEDD